MDFVPGGNIAEELLNALVDWLFEHKIDSNNNAEAALDSLEQSVKEFLPEMN